jgi:hypothetical protein
MIYPKGNGMLLKDFKQGRDMIIFLAILRKAYWRNPSTNINLEAMVTQEGNDCGTD